MSFFNLKKKPILWGLLLCTLIFVGFSSAEEVFPKFSSRSSKGERVSNAIFADAKLTMINVWATWCPPCVGEMPDLGLLGRSMPKGSQLVGIILDAGDSGALEEAEEILTQAKADFLQILPVEAMGPVLKKIDAIPTTIFVDSQGNIVGDPLVGSRSGGAYREEIEKRLEKTAR
ncbi:MAG: TlpA family protein disulfide reductase [Synergistaceae bacterium]|nr:TlpA family protein disulfide reductase [Synergistaceae bacterium]